MASRRFRTSIRYFSSADGDFPFQRVINHAKATGQSARLEAMMGEIGEMVKAQDVYLKSHTVLQTLLNLAGGWLIAWLIITGLPGLRSTAVESGTHYATLGVSARSFALAVLAGAVWWQRGEAFWTDGRSTHVAVGGFAWYNSTR